MQVRVTHNIQLRPHSKVLETCLPCTILGSGPACVVPTLSSLDELKKLREGKYHPKKDIGIQKSKKTPFGQEVSVI